VVRLAIASLSEDLLAVVDSGSPLSVADAALFLGSASTRACGD
jgi:hypothetical protein